MSFTDTVLISVANLALDIAFSIFAGLLYVKTQERGFLLIMLAPLSAILTSTLFSSYIANNPSIGDVYLILLSAEPLLRNAVYTILISLGIYDCVNAHAETGREQHVNTR